jgi:hypothetical protein
MSGAGTTRRKGSKPRAAGEESLTRIGESYGVSCDAHIEAVTFLPHLGRDVAAASPPLFTATPSWPLGTPRL